MTQHGYPYQPSGPGQPYGGQPAGAPGPYQAPPQTGYGVPPQAAGYGVPQAGYGQVGHPGYPPQPGYAPQAVGPNGEPLADQFIRLAARLIDGLIVGGIAMVIFIPIIVVIVIAASTEATLAADGTVSGGGPSLALLLLAYVGLFLFTLVAGYVYEVEIAKRTGQTVGKRLVKVRVVPLAPQQPITRGHLAKRWLVTGPGSLIPGLSLINSLWCLWDKPYRQCLHDKFAGTVVVKVPG